MKSDIEKKSSKRSEEWVFTCSTVMALWKRFPVSTSQARSSAVFENETVSKQTLYHLICGVFVRQPWTIILPHNHLCVCVCACAWHVRERLCECVCTIVAEHTVTCSSEHTYIHLHTHLPAWGIMCARTGWCFDCGEFAYSWEENHLWFDECWQKGLLDRSWHS